MLNLPQKISTSFKNFLKVSKDDIQEKLVLQNSLPKKIRIKNM